MSQEPKRARKYDDKFIRWQPSEKQAGEWLTDPCSLGLVVAASVSGALLAHYLRHRPSLQRPQNVFGPREAALAEAENRDEVYPRLVLRRKPTGPLDDDLDGNAHRAGHLAEEDKDDGSRAKTSERVASPWWGCGWVSSEQGTENAPCASRAG